MRPDAPHVLHQVSLDFFISIMTSVIDLVSFSGILYSIYPELFYLIFAYATFGSLTTISLGKTLVGQNAQVLLREANLRYSLVRLRENAESIAFYRGEEREAGEVRDRLDSTVESRRAVLGTQRNLEFFTTAYSYLVQILPGARFHGHRARDALLHMPLLLTPLLCSPMYSSSPRRLAALLCRHHRARRDHPV
jgi:ABC-type uncharacterized transport system fused permease/ATPase subunit